MYRLDVTWSIWNDESLSRQYREQFLSWMSPPHLKYNEERRHIAWHWTSPFGEMLPIISEWLNFIAPNNKNCSGEINCCSPFDAALLFKPSRQERDGERQSASADVTLISPWPYEGAYASSTPEQLAQSDPTDVLSEELGQTLEHLFGSCPDWLRPLTIPRTPGVAEQGLSEVVVPTNLRVMSLCGPRMDMYCIR